MQKFKTEAVDFLGSLLIVGMLLAAMMYPV